MGVKAVGFVADISVNDDRRRLFKEIDSLINGF
jgi:hypothetical protein